MPKNTENGWDKPPIPGIPRTTGIYAGIVEPDTVRTEKRTSKTGEYDSTEMVMRMMHKSAGASVKGRYRVTVPGADGILISSIREPMLLSVETNARGFFNVRYLGTVDEMRAMVEEMGVE